MRALYPRAQPAPEETLQCALDAARDIAEQPWRSFSLPLDIEGTEFQLRVWTALRDISPGVTVSYAEVAQRIGAPKALRAVAGACAANHLAIVIPCHRVLRLNGSLSGYRWGRERKLRLIELEKGAAMRPRRRRASPQVRERACVGFPPARAQNHFAGWRRRFTGGWTRRVRLIIGPG